jgi:two-component system NarL family sensor kinase
MWISLKHSGESNRSSAHLDALVLQHTVAKQNLSQRLLKAQDDERRRVARDLHDSTGQTLAALRISVACLQTRLLEHLDPTAVVADIAELADQALREIRTTSYLLHPPLLDEVGFTSAAGWFVAGFAKRSGIKATLEIGIEHERLPIAIETALFRVLQESLTNVHRHSGAAEVVIHFQQDAETATLEIRDSGRGMPKSLLGRIGKANAGDGVGLAGMRERLNDLNGNLEIKSDKSGTSLRATVPVPGVMSVIQFAPLASMRLDALAG